MFKGLKNTNYYLGEVKTIIKLNGFSSFLSVISLSLIFFITTLTLTGWWLSTTFTNALENEAEISAYYPADISLNNVQGLILEIQKMEGVKTVTAVTAEQAYDKMSEILGQEAKILSQFDENPFEAYLEIGIDLDRLEPILTTLELNDQLEYIRDNRTILEKISRISTLIALLGIIMTLAVGISTFIITSHIIREGVHAHEAQINTLQLLGAPDTFINLPFIIEGALLALISGILAAIAYLGFMRVVGNFTDGVIPFFPIIETQTVFISISVGTICVSLILGLLASLFGLKLNKKK